MQRAPQVSAGEGESVSIAGVPAAAEMRAAVLALRNLAEASHRAGVRRAPTRAELAAAREDGRSACIDAAKDEGLGAPPSEREPLANPDLDAAHRKGWDSVTDAEREGAFKAAQIASERHDTTLSPRTGGGAHKGQHGTAARRARRQTTDDVGDGA